MTAAWRHVFYIGALLFSFTVVGVEIGASVVDLPGPTAASLAAGIRDSGVEGMSADALMDHRAAHPPAPGLGLPALALIDGWWLLSVIFVGLPFAIGFKAFTPTQAVVTLLLALGLLVGSIVVLLMAITLTMTMISLLLAVPFGTLAYLAIWGTFDTGTAGALLGVGLFARLGAGLCLVVSHPKHVTHTALWVLFVVGLGCSALLSLLHGLPPGLLVSITDAIGAIVFAVVGIIYALVHLVRALRALWRLAT